MIESQEATLEPNLKKLHLSEPLSMKLGRHMQKLNTRTLARLRPHKHPTEAAVTLARASVGFEQGLRAME